MFVDARSLPDKSQIDTDVCIVGAGPAGITVALEPMASIHPRFHGLYLRAHLAGRRAFYDSSKAAKELEYRPRSFDAILDECVRLLRS